MACALGIEQNCNECRMCGNGKGGKKMEHDGCKGCRYERENSDSIHCQGCKQNAVDKYAKMTNADKIRSMTDEELAEFLTKQFCHGVGENLIKEWLESECDAEC